MFRLRSLLRPAAAAALCLLGAGAASALTLVTGSYAQSGLGAEFSTPYDTFSVSGMTQTLALPAAPADIAVADYAFEVGPNCTSCSLTPSFDALFNVSVDGHTLQLDLPFTWSSTGPTDTLSFAAAAPVVFDLGAAGSLRFVLDDIGALASSGGMTRGQLYANVSVTPVPEPTSAALLAAGFGLVSFVARRRRVKR